MRAFFETKTVVALFKRLHRLVLFTDAKQPLTTATIVLNYLPFAIGFTPVDIGKATAGAKYLHRLTVGIGLLLPHFRVIQIHRIAGVINHQTLLLALIQT